MEPRAALHSTIVWNRCHSSLQPRDGCNASDKVDTTTSCKSSSSSSGSSSRIDTCCGLPISASTSATAVDNNNNNNKEPSLVLGLPTEPVHPALEYEVAVTKDDLIVPTNEHSIWDTEEDSDENSNNNTPDTRNLHLFIAFFFLIVSGVGTVISAKLQAISMRNYPNFLNIFGQFLYIPLCFAYLVPASRWGGSGSLSLWPRRKLLKRFAIMGALDCLSTTLQTFAAVYLPGPLLILLPQMAIPVSMVLTAIISRHGIPDTSQWLGATTVLLGVVVVLKPVLSRVHAPDYYCEAQDQQNYCTLCQAASTEYECLELQQEQHSSLQFTKRASTSEYRWLQGNDNTLSPNPCRWLPFQQSSKEKEVLEIVWSLALLASTIPMALSALYKQRTMRSAAIEHHPDATRQNPPPALYVSGWIAVFQFVCSVFVAIPAGLMSSPTIIPLQVPTNFFHGMVCYAGVGFVESGCHPDTACSQSALWVNVTVICHVVYTLSMTLVLKYSVGSSPLFLALTAIVPLSHLVFTLPFIPEHTPIRTADLAGLIIILAGLVLYRFSTSISGTSFVSPDSIVGASTDTAKARAKERQDQEHRRSQSISVIDFFNAKYNSDDDNIMIDEIEKESDLSVSNLNLIWFKPNPASYTLLRRDGVAMRSEDV